MAWVVVSIPQLHKKLYLLFTTWLDNTWHISWREKPLYYANCNSSALTKKKSTQPVQFSIRQNTTIKLAPYRMIATAGFTPESKNTIRITFRLMIWLRRGLDRQHKRMLLATAYICQWPHINNTTLTSRVGKSSSCLAEVKAGCVHLCRVTGNTAWFNMASDVNLQPIITWQITD